MGVAGQIRPWWSKIGMRESAEDADGGGQSNWKPGPGRRRKRRRRRWRPRRRRPFFA